MLFTRGLSAHTSPRLLASYGLTLETYDELLAFQGGRCAICRRRPDKRALHVDHDHLTGRVRGLLCTSCNVGLGGFRDRQRLLDRAKAYLAAPPAKNFAPKLNNNPVVTNTRSMKDA